MVACPVYVNYAFAFIFAIRMYRPEKRRRADRIKGRGEVGGRKAKKEETKTRELRKDRNKKIRQVL
jgi:hypothetical protein